MMEMYGKYKDSGVRWIGEIPEHWKSWKLSHAFDKIGSGTTPEAGADRYYENGTIYWLNTGDLNDGVLNACNKKVTSDALKDYSALKLFPKRSLAIAMYGATIGKTAYLEFATTTNQACCVFCEGDIIDNKFLQYWFKANQEQIITLAIGGGQPNISQSIIKDIRLFCPSLDEQKLIVENLDKKTTELDTLISKKEKLIELLKEERTAIINQAVTKGLDPDVEMKDSGVEWLGEIPVHWDSKPLRYVGETQNGISAGAEYFGFGFPFISYGDVYKNPILPKFVVGLANSTEKERANFSVKKGDVLFTRTSETVEEIGIASICMEDVENAIYAGFLIRFRPNENLLFEGFSKYYFRNNIHRIFFIKEMNIVTRASLSQGLLKRLLILLPSIKEQIEISEFLDQKTMEVDNILSKTNQEITLLKEYKTALISEVVTGKVKVI